MKPAQALLLIGCSFASFAADPLDVNKVSPEAAVMSAERLAAIPIRIKAYVDTNQTAGIVTLVGRHGRVASFDAVGYQDVESKKPMRKDSLFRVASLTKAPSRRAPERAMQPAACTDSNGFHVQPEIRHAAVIGVQGASAKSRRSRCKTGQPQRPYLAMGNVRRMQT